MLTSENNITVRLSGDSSVFEIAVTVDGETSLIRDVRALRTVLDGHSSVVTPSQGRAFGVLHVLLAAAELGSVEAVALRPAIERYRAPFDDPACTNAFTAGEETALYDLRAVPPSPLLVALRRLAAAALP